MCPYSQRAWIALNAKGVRYTLKEVDLVDKSSEFTRAYRLAIGHDRTSDGKVPILKVIKEREEQFQHSGTNGDESPDIDETYIIDSIPVVDYLAQAHQAQGHDLLYSNSSPLSLYKARIFIDYFNSKYAPAFHHKMWLVVKPENESKQQDMADLYEGLRYLEQLMEELGGEGPFVTGETWGIAEVVVFSMFCSDRIEVLERRGFSWDDARVPRIRNMARLLEEIEPFKATKMGSLEIENRMRDISNRRALKATQSKP